MTLRHTLVPALLMAALAATGAHAQVRMESDTSAFVWEALGATPSIRLPQRQSSAKPAAATPVAKDANAAAGNAATAKTVPARLSDFTYDELGATPQLKRPSTTAKANDATGATR